MSEMHVSKIFEKHPSVCCGDYALFCEKYAKMVRKPWYEWKDDEACFGCDSYMNNADFFCREFNKVTFGKERIEPENQPPWWENPAFLVEKKNIYGIGADAEATA